MVGASLIGVCTGPGIGKAGLRGAWPGKFVSAHQRFGAAALALFLVGVAAGQVLPFQSPRASFANGECGIIAAARMPLANCVRSSSGNDPGQETIAATGLLPGESFSVHNRRSEVFSLQPVATSSNAAVSATAEQSPATANHGDLPEFKRRVEARFKAARKGMIELFLPETWKTNETVVVKVVVLRPPEGADGFLPASLAKDAKSHAADLLKVDDEMQVVLSSKEAESTEIQPDRSPLPQPIHHILAGGHTEWKWQVKAAEPGEKHLMVTAEVVYRRKFSPDGPPTVTFKSVSEIVPVQVLP